MVSITSAYGSAQRRPVGLRPECLMEALLLFFDLFDRIRPATRRFLCFSQPPFCSVHVKRTSKRLSVALFVAHLFASNEIFGNSYSVAE